MNLTEYDALSATGKLNVLFADKTIRYLHYEHLTTTVMCRIYTHKPVLSQFIEGRGPDPESAAQDCLAKLDEALNASLPRREVLRDVDGNYRDGAGNVVHRLSENGADPTK